MSSDQLLSASAARDALAHLFPDAKALDDAVFRLLNASSGEQIPPEGDGGVDPDLQRAQRCGFPEVVFGEGKTVDMVVIILRAQRHAGQDSLITRAQPEHVQAVLRDYPEAIHNEVARTIRLHNQTDTLALKRGPVFVVTAGSSDRQVAEEAMETLKWMRVECELIQDVGVAGPHRLQRHVAKLQKAAAIVCVAGMEAALPSVVGGYVPCPVIGVPTSVGYGASLHGITAMLSMLTCCSSNVVCVNIDAGFKGGYVAGLIASRMQA